MLESLRRKRVWNRGSVQRELGWSLPIWILFTLLQHPVLGVVVLLGGRLVWESYQIKKEYE